MSTDLKTASVLAFERKLNTSDALFFSGMWEERGKKDAWQPVAVREKSVRGTMSHSGLGKIQDPVKINAKLENPNLQKVDVAALPVSADTLKVDFTLRVLAGAGTPSACNNAEYQKKLIQTVDSYCAAEGFGELARRYAHNLANGRFLWRNRVGAEQVEVRVSHLVDGAQASTWTFDALSLSLRDFETPADSKASLEALTALMAEGLGGSRHVLLGVTAFVRLGSGQEVFPSEELILDAKNPKRPKSEKKESREDLSSAEPDREDKKKKTLYQVSGIAGMHSQKLGNAIRTIDTWYPGAKELGPIAVEPYGAVTTQSKAYRQPKDKVDFYTLRDGWILKDKAPTLENQHYVIAVLIRGGVFGEKD